MSGLTQGFAATAELLAEHGSLDHRHGMAPLPSPEVIVPFAVTDAVSQVLATALDGVSMRQQVTADNIANVDTPNFRATSVDFESQLNAAIDDGSFDSGNPFSVDVTSTPTDTPVGANGNNVDLRKETMSAIQSQYQYQVLTRAVSDHFDLLKTAASEA